MIPQKSVLAEFHKSQILKSLGLRINDLEGQRSLHEIINNDSMTIYYKSQNPFSSRFLAGRLFDRHELGEICTTRI